MADIKQTGNYAVIGETARGDLYTYYEEGNPAFVGRELAIHPHAPADATREVLIYLGQNDGELVVGNLNVVRIQQDGTRLRDDQASAAIIGGRLFRVGGPIGGETVEPVAYEHNKPVLAKAAEHLSVASFMPVSFTDRPGGRANRAAAGLHLARG